MRISAKPLLNYVNVNNFFYGNQWVIRSGDTNTLYFQLVDLDKFVISGNSAVPGLRYFAGIGVANQPASMVLTFPSIDDTKIIALNATQDPNDLSIWSVTMPSTQTPASGNVLFQLTEGSSVRKFSVMALTTVEIPGLDGST